MRTSITLWTPDEPEGYGVHGQKDDDYRAFVLHHSSLTDDGEEDVTEQFNILWDEEEEGFVCR